MEDAAWGAFGSEEHSCVEGSSSRVPSPAPLLTSWVTEADGWSSFCASLFSPMKWILKSRNHLRGSV